MKEIRAMGMTFKMASDEVQLRNNAMSLLGEYYNGMTDYPEEYPPLSADECVEYCIPDVYNMYSNGNGFEGYADGVCQHLKFLGTEKIRQIILEVADECEVLI